MRRTALALALVLVLIASPPSFGVSFAGAIGVIRTHLSDRIAEVAGLASPTAAELKEAAGLEKALGSLDAYTGGVGQKDLGVVAKALGTIYKTGTPDPDLNSSCPGILGFYNSIAQSQRSQAEDARWRIASGAGQAKVTAAIDSAENIRFWAGAEPDWGKRAKLYLKAQAAFAKAAIAAWKILDKEVAATQSFACSFPEVLAFAAEGSDVAGGWDQDGHLHIHGRMPGSPAYLVVVAIDSPAFPGAYELMNNETYVRKAEGDTTWTWYHTSGTIEIEILTKRTAIGTFAFRAGDQFDVTAGTFRVSLGKWVPPPGAD
jgi:hypothetical protein